MIKHEIAAIISQYFGVMPQESDYDKLLMSPPFAFDGVDLCYLFLIIQESFDIEIPDDELLNYGFSTISKIAAIVETLLKN